MPKAPVSKLKQKKGEAHNKAALPQEPVKGKIPSKSRHVTTLEHIMKGLEARKNFTALSEDNFLYLKGGLYPNWFDYHKNDLNLMAKRSRIHMWKHMRKLDASLAVVRNIWNMSILNGNNSRKLPCIDSLKSFSLRSIPDPMGFVGDLEMKSLSVEVKRHLSKLQDLSLDLSMLNVQIPVMNQTISSIVKNMIYLEKFRLKLCGVQMWDQFINALGVTLSRYLFRLKELELHLGCATNYKVFSVTEKAQIDLFTILCTNLLDLEKLTLKFVWNPRISDKLLKILVKLIGKNLTSLKDLTLIFVGAEKVTSDGFKELGVEICNRLKGITSFSINLEQGHRLLPSESKMFSLKLKKEMKQLEYLEVMGNVAIDKRP